MRAFWETHFISWLNVLTSWLNVLTSTCLCWTTLRNIRNICKGLSSAGMLQVCLSKIEWTYCVNTFGWRVIMSSWKVPNIYKYQISIKYRHDNVLSPYSTIGTQYIVISIQSSRNSSPAASRKLSGPKATLNCKVYQISKLGLTFVIYERPNEISRIKFFWTSRYFQSEFQMGMLS